jgi:hypothetical protein
MHDELSTNVELTHEVLAARLAHARSSRPTPDRPRDRFPATDRFLASTSRHVAAANAVLVPAVARRVPEGRQLAREFARQSRRLEAALAQAKGKLYGSTYSIRRPWTAVWDEVHDELEAWCALEEKLVARLPADEDVRRGLARRLFADESHAPSRPHPYLPHRGLAGRVARRVARGVDQFWDTAEGRMLPEPVHTATHGRNGRMARYLLADPDVDAAGSGEPGPQTALKSAPERAPKQARRRLRTPGRSGPPSR